MSAPMHPGEIARAHPNKPAYIMASTGETVTYRQLDEESNRDKPGSGVAPSMLVCTPPIT